MMWLFSPEDIIASLEIGNSKVTLVIASTTGEELEILGVGKAEVKGFSKGVVNDLNSLSDSIYRALREAELMAGCKIGEVLVNISNLEVRSWTATAEEHLPSKEVGESELKRLFSKFYSSLSDPSLQFVHLLPRNFSLNGLSMGLSNPLGLQGEVLKGAAHLIAAPQTAVSNIKRAVESSGLRVRGLVWDGLASAEGVLAPDEKKLGVAVVDLGAFSTRIAAVKEGQLFFSATLPWGGDSITKELSLRLRIPLAEAEKLKVHCAAARSSLLRRDEKIRLHTPFKRRFSQLTRKFLSQLVEPSVDDLIYSLRETFEKNGLNAHLEAGLVITGGASKLEGLADVLEYELGLPVRQGLPRPFGGLSSLLRYPEYSVAAGILRWAVTLEREPVIRVANGFSLGESFSIRRISRSVRRWLAQFL